MKFNLGDHAFYIQINKILRIVPVTIIDHLQQGEYMVEERGLEEPDRFPVTSKELFNHARAVQKAKEFIEKN